MEQQKKSLQAEAALLYKQLSDNLSEQKLQIREQLARELRQEVAQSVQALAADIRTGLAAFQSDMAESRNAYDQKLLLLENRYVCFR